MMTSRGNKSSDLLLARATRGVDAVASGPGSEASGGPRLKIYRRRGRLAHEFARTAWPNLLWVEDGALIDVDDSD